MNPLEYMQTVRSMILDSIVKNEEAIVQIRHNLSTAEEYSAVLEDYLKNCEKIIAILSQSNS